MGEARYVDRVCSIGLSEVGAIKLCPYSRTRVNLDRDPEIGGKPHQWSECVIGDGKSSRRDFADADEAEIPYSVADD